MEKQAEPERETGVEQRFIGFGVLGLGFGTFIWINVRDPFYFCGV